MNASGWSGRHGGGSWRIHSSDELSAARQDAESVPGPELKSRSSSPGRNRGGGGGGGEVDAAAAAAVDVMGPLRDYDQMCPACTPARSAIFSTRG